MNLADHPNLNLCVIAPEIQSHLLSFGKTRFPIKNACLIKHRDLAKLLVTQRPIRQRGDRDGGRKLPLPLPLPPILRSESY